MTYITLPSYGTYALMQYPSHPSSVLESVDIRKQSGYGWLIALNSFMRLLLSGTI
jgi:hypothetical protein